MASRIQWLFRRLRISLGIFVLVAVLAGTGAGVYLSSRNSVVDLQGVVTDANGESVLIWVTHLESEETFQIQTDIDGRFTLPSAKLGQYDVYLSFIRVGDDQPCLDPRHRSVRIVVSRLRREFEF